MLVMVIVIVVGRHQHAGRGALARQGRDARCAAEDLAFAKIQKIHPKRSGLPIVFYGGFYKYAGMFLRQIIMLECLGLNACFRM
jgi:hypothetical protein